MIYANRRFNAAFTIILIHWKIQLLTLTPISLRSVLLSDSHLLLDPTPWFMKHEDNASYHEGGTQAEDIWEQNLDKFLDFCNFGDGDWMRFHNEKRHDLYCSPTPWFMKTGGSMLHSQWSLSTGKSNFSHWHPFLLRYVLLLDSHLP